MNVIITNFYTDIRNNHKSIDVEMTIDEKRLEKSQTGDFYFLKDDRDFLENINQAKKILNSKKKTYRTFYTYSIIEKK